MVDQKNVQSTQGAYSVASLELENEVPQTCVELLFTRVGTRIGSQKFHDPFRVREAMRARLRDRVSTSGKKIKGMIPESSLFHRGALLNRRCGPHAWPTILV
jgi:hypothetical protein